MIQLKSRRPRCGSRVSTLALAMAALAACDAPGPLTPPAEPLADAELAMAAVPPGIMFASSGLTPAQMNSTHTGTVSGGSPSTILTYLSQVKAKGGRVVLRLHGDAVVRNADNTFNLNKWKTSVARFKDTNFGRYIDDGTIVAHHLIDEPHFPSRWGGKTIPQGTVELMAKHSKLLWPTLITVAAAPPTWLADTTITYKSLDAAWSTYMANMGSNYTRWAASQVTAAKSKGLGLIGGLNVLDGGNGTSGFRGNLPRRWAMSAAELQAYGLAILAQTHVCAFIMWKYTPAYHDRPDVKNAMAVLSKKAREHPRTSCRQ